MQEKVEKLFKAIQQVEEFNKKTCSVDYETFKKTLDEYIEMHELLALASLSESQKISLSSLIRGFVLARYIDSQNKRESLKELLKD